MKLLTIIVNYKTPELTIQGLSALMAELEGIDGGRVVVVDNDSADGSFEKIRDAVQRQGLSERVSVIASPKNGGFAFGNNLAIREALLSDDPPEYVYLLNPDAAPDPGAVQRLLAYLDKHKDVGIAGSYIHGPDGEPHQTAFRFPTFLGELESGLRLGPVTRLLERWVVPMPIPAGTRQVDWLAGASMMIRREVFDEVGLFDETYFLYYEETDLCLRARRKGWPTVYVKDSSVIHVGSVSTGMKDQARRTPRFWFDSRRHYFLKNHGRSYLWAANAAWLVGFSLFRVRRRVQNKPDRDRPHALLDFVSHTVKTELSRLARSR